MGCHTLALAEMMPLVPTLPTGGAIGSYSNTIHMGMMYSIVIGAHTRPGAHAYYGLISWGVGGIYLESYVCPDHTIYRYTRIKFPIVLKGL